MIMDKDKKKIGLYICATPIGNLEDASYRLINTLKDVDIIAAEDTRTTKQLLERYSISGKRIISYHDFSESNRLDLILS